MKKLLCVFGFLSAFLIGANTQAATIGLSAITVNGDKMVNDSVLGVTWADTIPACHVTAQAGIVDCVHFYSGPDNYYGTSYAYSAQEWVTGLNLQNYGGHSDWRLASSDGSLNDHSCSSNSSDELGCLFFNELGAVAWQAINEFGPFSNIQNGQTRYYWSGSEATYGSGAYVLSAYQAYQTAAPDINSFLALAVRTGLTEVAPVPVPASAWLLLGGLSGLGLMSRKRKV